MYADNQVAIDVLWVKFQNRIVIFAGGRGHVQRGDIFLLHHPDIKSFKAGRKAACKQGIGIVGIRCKPAIAEIERVLIQSVNLGPNLHIFDDWMLARQKTILNVESGVEQIQPIQLSKDGVIQDIIDGHGIGGMFRGNLLEQNLRRAVIEIVKVLVRGLNIRLKIQGIGIGAVGSLDGGKCR